MVPAMKTGARVRRLSLVFLLAIAPACGGGGGDDDDDTNADGPAYSLGTCPVFEAGVQSFASGDLTYDVTVKLPANPTGAPIAFVFHGLNGSPDRILTGLDADRLVDLGAIVVAPQSAAESDYEWQFLIGPDENDDLQMFYDLLGCLHRQYDTDMDRVWVTGMSAGGLWSSYLAVYASEWVTAAAPFSGGIILQVPSTERSIPVMLTWGGPDDHWEAFNFDDASKTLESWLVFYGHPVIECVHDLGHAIPPEGPAMLEAFLRDQRWGDPDPFADGLTADFPSWCTQPQPE